MRLSSSTPTFTLIEGTVGRCESMTARAKHLQILKSRVFVITVHMVNGERYLPLCFQFLRLSTTYRCRPETEILSYMQCLYRKSDDHRARSNVGISSCHF